MVEPIKNTSSSLRWPDTCPICNSNTWIPGQIKSAEGLTFHGQTRSLVSDSIRSGKPIRARQCARCGNILLFADVER